MDGLLIDSMIFWLEEDNFFLREYGIEITNEMVQYLTGRSEREGTQWIKETFSLSPSVDFLIDQRQSKTDKIYSHKANLMPGVEELIKKVKKSGLKQALASGAPLNKINIAADRFGWRDSFDIFVAPEHVGHAGKPDPAIFLHTAKKLKVKPEECVVFEDAENGVVAAKRAGMKCIAVPDPRWSFGDFSQADLIVDSLEDEKIIKYLALI